MNLPRMTTGAAAPAIGVAGAPGPASADAPGEIYLQPGDWHFGSGNTRVRTLLGSCVAIAVWHPRLRVGGLCHFMLPTRNAYARHGHPPHGQGGHGAHLDGRYADEAMYLFLRSMHAAGARPQEFDAKLFGGGRMFGGEGAAGDVPYRNIAAARALVQQHGMRLRAEHLGGQGHRNLVFELWSGDAYLRFWGQGAEQNQTEIRG